MNPAFPSSFLKISSKFSICKSCGLCCESCCNHFADGCFLPIEKLPQNCREFPFITSPSPDSESLNLALGINLPNSFLTSFRLFIGFFVACKAVLSENHFLIINYVLKAVNQKNVTFLAIYESVGEEYTCICLQSPSNSSNTFYDNML